MMPAQQKIGIIDVYYQLVDSEQWIELCELFSDDTVYERDGTGAIVGKAALLQFYTVERVIARGQHVHLINAVTPEGVRSTGCFVGELKSGQAVKSNFIDHFYINDAGLIYKRVTEFPTGEQKI